MRPPAWTPAPPCWPRCSRTCDAHAHVTRAERCPQAAVVCGGQGARVWELGGGCGLTLELTLRASPCGLVVEGGMSGALARVRLPVQYGQSDSDQRVGIFNWLFYCNNSSLAISDNCSVAQHAKGDERVLASLFAA